MEKDIELGSTGQASPEVPSLIQFISSNEVSGFDDLKCTSLTADQIEPTESESLSSSSDEKETEPTIHHQRIRSVSISMPPSPVGVHLQDTRRVLFSTETNGGLDSPVVPDIASGKPPRKPKHFSQPMPKTGSYTQTNAGGQFAYHQSIKTFKDKRFDSFKTWSGKLERQITILRGRPPQEEDETEEETMPKREVERNLPVERYFDALQGPELDTLKASEEMVLPHDSTWPFLLRYPISSFGICLGISSQAIMWKALATSPSTKFLHISLKVNLVLWCLSIALVATVGSIYLLKMILYFEAVRREYYHPVRINFFFAPWIALMFLGLGVPPSITTHLPQPLWYVLMCPLFLLELKIYGQWMSGGRRRLSKVCNPSNHLAVVGNFVGALLGASMGLKEGPIFFFAVGLAHYVVLFVTLYQRLPTNETLPKDLHPVFFLFVAAPSVASIAWATIQGSFDFGARIAYFIALFLYMSLAVRLNFFRGFKFSVAWWAYTFPMTGAAIATMKYSSQVGGVVTQAMAVLLSGIATLTVAGLFITTILHAFVLRDLFPNDIAIAISDKKPKPHKKWFHLRHGSSDSSDIEKFLKFNCVSCKVPEAAQNPQLVENQGA